MPWKKYISPKGKPYYHNSDTNTTTWTKPSDFTEPAPTTNNSSEQSNLYVKVTNAKGKVYYYNQATNETCWVVPEGGKVITRRHSALMQLAQGKGPAGTNTSPVKKAALRVYESEMQSQNVPVAPSTQAKPALPSDWDAVKDEATGKTYYWNKITGKTSWTMPGGLAAPSASNKSGRSLTGSGKMKKGRRKKNVVGESVGDDEYVRENIKKITSSTKYYTQSIKK